MPRQSASSKGKGKEVEDPTQLTEADTAQSAGQASRKLSHLYRLAFRYPQAVTIQQVVVDEEVKDVEPTLLARWRHMRALPLWEQQCPPEFADEWGTRWNALHSALKNMSTLSTVTAVNKFKWKGNGLEDVALLAKTGKWDSCLNDDIESALEDDGKSIRAMYCTPYVCAQVVQTGPDGKQVTKGFVSPMHWDGYLSYLVPRILGCAFEYIDPDLIDWWHAMLAAILDARAKQRTRLDKRRDKHLKAVMAKLGAELWQFRLPNHLTVKKAQSALLSLKEVKVCLEWLTTSAEDAKIRAEPIDVEADDAAAKIQSRWARLSENAQKQDWVQMMLGFVMGLLGRRMDKEFPIDFGEEGQVYEYGICLAKAIPAQDLNQRFVQPDAEEVRAFHLKVVDFADSWLGRAHPTNLDTAIGLYFDPAFEEVHATWALEGKDIGTSKFKNMSPGQLHEHLGFVDGLPLTFRRYTTDEPGKIMNNGEKEFLDSTKVEIAWHQLGFVHFMFSILANDKLADLEEIHHTSVGLDKAPIAIRNKWAQVPGMCLFDEVGLGKTVCAMAGIGALQNIFVLHTKIASEEDAERKAELRRGLPACVRDAPKFAAVEDQVPNQPHLIVVPPSLVDQWAAELKRFFRTDRIRLVVVSTRAVDWANDMKNIRQSDGLAGVFVIVLVPSSVLKRMFTQSQSRIVFKEVNGLPRLAYHPPADTLYSFSWCSTWIDEVHDARKGTPLWRSMRAVFEATLVKTIMTATPLMEAPPDLLHLARLSFPPTLTWPALAELSAVVRDLRLVKAKTNADVHQSAIELAGKDKIVAAGSGLASAALATDIVTRLQRHLIPYTIRRGPDSTDWEGKSLNAQLPPRTIIHVGLEVTEHERNESYSNLEDSVAIKKFDVDTHGAFFLKGRQVLTIPDKMPSSLKAMTREEFMALATTKIRAMFDLVAKNLTVGPEAYIPPEFTGSNDNIADIGRLDVSDLIKGWDLQPIDPSKKKHNEKTIVYTYFQAHHDLLVRGFELFGITAVSISGANSIAERTKIIGRFKADDSIDVLIMSSVGLTGLNLTCARNLIVLETGWSAVQSQQLYGRIYRRGQTRETYILQLFAKDTVDVFMVANGLGKHQLLHQFLTLDRSQKTLRLLAGRATAAEMEELEERLDDVSEDTIADLADKLKTAKSTVGKAMREKGKKTTPAKSRKRKAVDAEEEAESGEEEEVEPKPKRRRTKKAVEEPEAAEGSSTKKSRAKKSRVTAKVGSLAPGPTTAGPSNRSGSPATYHAGVLPDVPPVEDVTESAMVVDRLPEEKPSEAVQPAAPPEASAFTFTAPPESAGIEASLHSSVPRPEAQLPEAQLPAASNDQLDNWAVGPDGTLLTAEEMGPWPESPSDETPPLPVEPDPTNFAANIEETRHMLAQTGLLKVPRDWLMEDDSTGEAILDGQLPPLTPTQTVEEPEMQPETSPGPSAFREQHRSETPRVKVPAASTSRKVRTNPVQPQDGPSMEPKPKKGRGRGRAAGSRKQ